MCYTILAISHVSNSSLSVAFTPPLYPRFIRFMSLTLHVELDGGVAHSHHVLCDARQLEVVVFPADVEQSQVDGVDVRPVHIRLKKENETQTESHCEGYRACTVIFLGLN